MRTKVARHATNTALRLRIAPSSGQPTGDLRKQLRERPLRDVICCEDDSAALSQAVRATGCRLLHYLPPSVDAAIPLQGTAAPASWWRTVPRTRTTWAKGKSANPRLCWADNTLVSTGLSPAIEAAIEPGDEQSIASSTSASNLVPLFVWEGGGDTC